MSEKETEQEFMIFAGPRLSIEELQAQQAHDLDEDVEFISPNAPGRTVRLTSVPPVEDGGS